MTKAERYYQVRDGLNPHREARPPYQNEMVQWNDGYDRGYKQAERELEASWKAGYDNLMVANDKIKAELKAKIDELQAAIVRLSSSPGKTDQ